MTRKTVRWITIVAACLVLVALAAFVNPRTRAQVQQQDTPRSIHAVKVAAGDTSKIADLGPTYHFLERKATRVTTRYEDSTAVAERGLDGDFRTHLRDLGGNELSQVAIDHDAVGSARLELSAGGERVFTQPRAGVRPTLDWANLQAHGLWKDGPSTPDDVEWQGGFVRRSGAKASRLDEGPVETETEFDGGLKVITARNSREIQVAPRVRRRPTFISRVLSNGIDVGTIRWYANEKVLAWDYPGLNKGFVNAERLKGSGGWTFTPTMAWANVQGLAFYEFHTRMKERGPVAQARPGLLQRALQSVAPSLSADTPGCDGGLHWLDGSVFRPCCDQHDRCYERSGGCSARSWFWASWWGNSWSCSVCNTQVTICFLTGGNVNLDYQYYDW